MSRVFRKRADDRDTAILLYWLLSNYIPRPLRMPSPDKTTTLQFGRWETPGVFALTFRVASLVQLNRLARGLRMPPVLRGQRWPRHAPDQPAPPPIDSYSASGIDALAVCLARLAYPGRLETLCSQLHLAWSASKMSAIISATIRHIENEFGQQILYDSRFFTDQQRLAVYADAIQQCGAPFDCCIGFVDGTTVHICRPTGEWVQAAFYSGHKRYHCLRYQVVALPDGMIASFFGPHPGASNDRTVLNVSELDSKLLNDLEPNPVIPGIAKYFIYGDGGYSGGALKTIFTAEDLDPGDVQQANGVRVSIENVLGASKGQQTRPVLHSLFPVDGALVSVPLHTRRPLVGQWAFTKYSMQLCLMVSPVALQIKVGAFLYNCVNCLCPAAVSRRFGVDPPSLEWYLGVNE
jgi:hypothetical protein